MSDMMTFPVTVEEFMEQYKIVDDEKVYTNGADLVPIFRMMQWFEHVSATDKNVGTTDTINRQQAIDAVTDELDRIDHVPQWVFDRLEERLKQLTPAQPAPCEDAVQWEQLERYADWFCADVSYPEFVREAKAFIKSVTPKQRTDLLKAEIKRMKRAFKTCINSDYYTGYMSALSAVEGYIAQLEGANNDT